MELYVVQYWSDITSEKKISKPKLSNPDGADNETSAKGPLYEEIELNKVNGMCLTDNVAYGHSNMEVWPGELY